MGEIRTPRRTIPRALIFAGGVVVACYGLGTLAVIKIVGLTGQLIDVGWVIDAVSKRRAARAELAVG